MTVKSELRLMLLIAAVAVVAFGAHYGWWVVLAAAVAGVLIAVRDRVPG